MNLNKCFYLCKMLVNCSKYIVRERNYFRTFPSTIRGQKYRGLLGTIPRIQDTLEPSHVLSLEYRGLLGTIPRIQDTLEPSHVLLEEYRGPPWDYTQNTGYFRTLPCIIRGIQDTFEPSYVLSEEYGILQNPPMYYQRNTEYFRTLPCIIRGIQDTLEPSHVLSEEYPQNTGNFRNLRPLYYYIGIHATGASWGLIQF